MKSCDALLQRVQNDDSELESMVILPMKTFGAAEVERLAQILASGANTNLRQISASGHRVPPRALAMLGKALATSGGQNVKELSVSDESMGDEGVVAFCEPLFGKSHLEHVDFGLKSLTSEGTATMGKVFGSSQSIKRLEIYRNPNIGDEGILALFSNAKDVNQKGQRVFPNLEFLDISECTIGSKGMEALTGHLLLSNTTRPKAMELIASLNPLTTASGTLLGRLISANALCKLSVKNCQLGDEGTLSLLEMATGSSSCTVLSILDLSQNGITTKGACGMATILSTKQEQLTLLTDINLSGNGDIGSEGVVALAKAFSSGPDKNKGFIRSLDMGSTNCGIDGAIALLEKCPSIKSLRLFDNNLRCEGFRNIAPHLRGGHSTLEHLDLGGNRAKAQAVAILLRSVLQEKSNPSVLHTLELGGNQGSDEVEEIIVEMSRSRPELDVARDKPKAQNSPEGERNFFQQN